MAEVNNKNNVSVEDFIAGIPDEQQRFESAELVDLIEKISKLKPVMWGSSTIGFGNYRYKYKSGREEDWFIVGFSPRRDSMTLYVTACMDKVGEYKELFAQLGKHKMGKGCVNIRSLADVNKETLKKIIESSLKVY